MTYQEIHRLRQVGLKQCMKCKMFMSERTYRQSHAKKCNAEHETEQADKPGKFGKYGNECPEEVRQLLDDQQRMEWLEALPVEEVAFYKHCSTTITVPDAAKEQWMKVFMLPLEMWEQGMKWE